MTKLFILNNPDLYQQCTQAMSESDELILIENAVQLTHSLPKAIKYKVYALKDDLIARGLNLNTSQVTLVDYDGFVELSLKNDSTLSWL